MNKEFLPLVREHSWNYFALHAQQRISVFQYFITIESALITAALVSIQYKKELNNPSWALVLGPMIIVFSFVFWKIDQRTRDLISNAENSLREIEKLVQAAAATGISLPFTEDPQNNSTKKYSALPLIPGRMTYSQSFGTIFLTCGLFGIVLSFAMYHAFHLVK
jgi:hypothetical protein